MYTNKYTLKFCLRCIYANVVKYYCNAHISIIMLPGLQTIGHMYAHKIRPNFELQLTVLIRKQIKVTDLNSDQEKYYFQMHVICAHSYAWFP